MRVVPGGKDLRIHSNKICPLMFNVDLNTLRSLIIVAREQSFTRAAAQLGVSQSAVSHTIRGLEEKLGLRLLTRTTRGVSLTEAGERLLLKIGPYYDGIYEELNALEEMRDKPTGTLRISTHDHAASTVIWPKLSKLLERYSELKLEVIINYAFIDIVAERFDAGVRLGDQVAKDMIAVRIGPDFRMGVVASPTYLTGKKMPQAPKDLTEHTCINLRLPTYGGLYAWEFSRNGKMIETQVHGQTIFNTTGQVLTAALEGHGLAYVPEDLAQPYIDSGQLVRLLEDWWPTFPGYHLYYPSRRQSSNAFSLMVDTLRYRG